MAYQTSLFDSFSAPADEHQLLRRLAPKLARTERLEPYELHTHRRPLLASFLGHALRNTDFYNNRINFDPSSPETLDKRWPEIPILTRAEAVANRERLVSRRVPPEAGSSENSQTSVSTGMPFRCKVSQSLETMSCALTERMFRWWRVDGKKAFAQITQSTSSGAPPRGGKVMQGWNSAGRPAPNISLPTVSTLTRNWTGCWRAGLLTWPRSQELSKTLLSRSNRAALSSHSTSCGP